MSDIILTRPQIKKLYREAVRKWGMGLQLGMLMEECAELIQATHKVVRNGTEDRHSINNLANEMAVC